MGVDFDVDLLVSAFFERHLFVMHHVVVSELFGAGVNALCLVRESLAADHFALKLDVGQFVFQLGCVGAPDHMYSFSKFDFEREVVIKGLGVENTVVG